MHAARGVAGFGLPFLLTLPTLIVVFLVIGIPLVYSLVLSLYRINMLTKRWIFVGLRNYLDVLPHPDFIAAMGRTPISRRSRSAAAWCSASPWRSCSTPPSPAATCCAASC